MTHAEKIKCQKCGGEISQDDSFMLREQVLCEDCYLVATQRVQTCDPIAVRSATQYRKASGLEATEGLTELQKAICEFVKSRSKVTAEDIISTFHLSTQDLENQIAILRHCELVKGQKEGDKVYLMTF